MLGDLRHALHRIRQRPTFALSIVVVLVLASSAVAAVLAVADAVILRPLPYADPERLAVIREVGAENHDVVEISHRNYLDWRMRTKSFQRLAAFGSVNWGQRLTGHGEPTTIPAAGVSASFFDVLGVPPQLGRVLRESDDHAKAAPVVVISDGLWQRLLGGDPNVVGRRLTLDGKSFEIVGVMPRGFDFPKGAELWIAVAPEIDAASAGIKTDALEARWFGVLFVVGRLQPGSTADQARRELDAINADIDRLAGPRPPRSVVLTTFEERLLGKTRPALVLLLCAVSLIILIACANVATLLLMRAARMQTETAVRLSLGAAAGHIYKLWLAETLLLFVTAGVAGLTLATLLLPLVIRLAPDSVYRIGDTRITVPIVSAVLAMMAGAALGTAALIAALTTVRVRLAHALRDSGSTATSSRMRAVRRFLVTAEVTVACVLLVGAGLTIRSFLNLRALELGFAADGVLTFNVAPSRAPTGGANRTFYASLLERLTALPDVLGAGAVSLRPLAFEGVGVDSRALPEGHDVDDMSAWMRFAVPVNKEVATPGYFSTMRIPLRDGRYFTEDDLETAPLVAIIGESTARRLFPGQRAVGRRISAGGEDVGPVFKQPWRTIVGVVSDVRYRGLQDVRFDYYLPYRQNQDRVQHVVVRTRGNPLQAIAQVKAEVRRLDPSAVVEGFTTMENLVDAAVAPWRLHMVLFAVLGALALAVASIGVYGVVQYAVVERWHELGIRAALGASVRQLTRLIVAEGAALAITGIALGVVAAWWLARLMTTILFGVAPGDAITFGAVAWVLVVLAAAASYVPARLASRVEPSVLLRSR
jgi:putative ABC transport system permease protein